MRETSSSFLCKEIRGQWVAYGQGELSLPKTQRVYTHLSRCSSCRVAIKEQQPQRLLATSVGSRTLRAGVLATVGTALFFLYGIYLPSLQRSAPSSASTHPVSAPMSTFVGRAGAAYYVRLHVADLGTAEGAISKILMEVPGLRAQGPYTGRYCITATPKQLTALMRRLEGMGDSETASVGNRPWWFEDTSVPNVCSVMLDLLPTS